MINNNLLLISKNKNKNKEFKMLVIYLFISVVLVLSYKYNNTNIRLLVTGASFICLLLIDNNKGFALISFLLSGSESILWTKI